MALKQQLNTDFSRVFFAEIDTIYPQSERQYACTAITDIHHCQLGVLRCLSSSTTGQEFLQYHADQDIADIDPGHFFKMIKSKRRLENITSINDLLAISMTEQIEDPYAQCHELDSWDVYAADGHYHKAACFDPKTLSSDGTTVKATATGHFFRMNMRTHHMSCLAMAEPKDGKKKEHDMAVIKRSSADHLRNGAPLGRKVMLIWDKACIDYRHWFTLKHNYGIYFTTCEKSNSTAKIISMNLVDPTDSRNEGVVSDHLVGTSCGVQLRRVVYTNPEDNVTYVYLTNNFSLPAYLIVLLYKHRWDIEKIFHEFKSKMKETKSWGSSIEAKKSHAIFECISHNLLLLLEKYVEKTEGIRDEVEEKKKVGRIKAAPEKLLEQQLEIADDIHDEAEDEAVRIKSVPGVIGKKLMNFINSALTRATQRTQRFIRWIRSRLYIDAPWSESMARLRKLWVLPV